MVEKLEDKLKFRRSSSINSEATIGVKVFRLVIIPVICGVMKINIAIQTYTPGSPNGFVQNDHKAAIQLPNRKREENNVIQILEGWDIDCSNAMAVYITFTLCRVSFTDTPAIDPIISWIKNPKIVAAINKSKIR